MRKQLAQGHYALLPSQYSSPPPVNRKSVALPIAPPHHTVSIGADTMRHGGTCTCPPLSRMVGPGGAVSRRTSNKKLQKDVG